MLKLKNPPLMKLFGTVIHKNKSDDYCDPAPLRLCLPNQYPVPFNKLVQGTTPPPPLNDHRQGFRLFEVNLMAASVQTQSKKKRNSTTPDAAGTGARKKTISRKQRNTDEEHLKVPEAIPSGFMEFIRTKQDFLCRKKLTVTDVSRTATRVFVISSSKADLFNGFLTGPAEMERLHTMTGIRVNVVDSKGKFHDEMDLAVWPSVGQVVLKKNWRPFIKVNELKAGDVLEFWGYRKDNRVCLAIEIVRKQAEALNDESQNSNSIDLSLSLNIQQQISMDSSSDESVCTKLCL